mgnify:CR=1 FL=1
MWAVRQYRGFDKRRKLAEGAELADATIGRPKVKCRVGRICAMPMCSPTLQTQSLAESCCVLGRVHGVRPAFLRCCA